MSIGNFASEQAVFTDGVRQDFILRPLLFKIFILPLVQIIENDHINYTAVYPVNPCPIQSLGKCVK